MAVPPPLDSLWQNEQDVAPPLFRADLKVDVAIVGAGITGISAAYFLKQMGKTVAVIDMHSIGAGETGHTTAHITEVLDLGYQALIAKFGQGGARRVAQSCREAMEKVETLGNCLNISCDLQRLPGFIFTEDATEVEFLHKERDA